MTDSIRWNGNAISMPGVYRDMPLDDYHRGDICVGPSVSSSVLRTLIDESPAHCWAKCPINPHRVAPADTEAFALGAAVHHLICGEIGFAEQFVIRPETLDGEKWHGNRTVCKRWKAAREKEGRTILTAENVEQIKGMAVSLGNFPLVQAGALNGQIERSFFWQDKETQLWLKARPDSWPSDSGDFVDLKTTTSVLYLNLQRAFADFSYVQQGSLVLEGAAALGIPAESFTLLWAEKTPPYCVRAQQLRDEDIARGHKLNRVAIRAFADCLASGVWPGPGDDRADAEYIDLPDWKRKQIDERLRLQLNEAA